LPAVLVLEYGPFTSKNGLCGYESWLVAVRTGHRTQKF
jgi:hypothetical protein